MLGTEAQTAYRTSDGYEQLRTRLANAEKDRESLTDAIRNQNEHIAELQQALKSKQRGLSPIPLFVLSGFVTCGTFVLACTVYHHWTWLYPATTAMGILAAITQIGVFLESLRRTGLFENERPKE